MAKKKKSGRITGVDIWKSKTHKRPQPTSSTRVPQGECVWDSVLGWISKKVKKEVRC